MVLDIDQVGYDERGYYYYHEYHAYWSDPYNRIKNPEFDDYSNNILNLKKLYVNEIERFKHYLSYVLIEDNVALVCVPSHTPNKKGAVHFIIESLCSERELVNASSCLQRTREIQKLAGGGSRSLEIHLGSISLINSHLLENRDILLIDDVSTSGNSLLACKQIIIRNTKNIKSITCFVFAKTV